MTDSMMCRQGVVGKARSCVAAAMALAATGVFAEPLVELVRDGTTVGRYETFAAGLNAATGGDTIRFLNDWVPDGWNTTTIGKSVTIDLDGHAATNGWNFNFFEIKASPVVFKNGIIGDTGSAVLTTSGGNKVYATNIVFTACAFAAGHADAELHAGSGCVFRSALIASWGMAGKVFVEDESVVAPSVLWTFTSNESVLGTGHVFIRGGKFSADPKTYAVGLTKTIARDEVTDYGTCHYAVVARGPDEPAVAGIVLGEGLTNVWDTLDQAITRAAAGGTVALLSDAIIGGYTTKLNKQLVLDLCGYKIENTWGNSVLEVQSGGTVVRNGTLCGNYNTLLNIVTDNATVYVTNVVFRNRATTEKAAVAGSAKRGAKAELSGCVLEPKMRLMTDLTTANLVSVDVRDCDAYLSTFIAGGEGAVQRIYSGRFTIDPKTYLADGVWQRTISETTSLGTLKYQVFPNSATEPLTIDLSGTDVPVIDGNMPSEGVTFHVAFADSGTWNGRRKVVADFSQLANVDKLKVSVTDYPSAYGNQFKTFMSEGKLYAKLDRGFMLIFR